MELLAGVVGGLGLFIVGMWFLTENLKKLASRRLRRNAQRWTTNPLAALFWGLLGGGITQSMSALTFIAVSILRSRLITLKGALAMILGGGIGVTGLVMIATFDIKMFALYVVGIAGAMVVTERLSKFRAIAGSFLGGGMVILGLVLVREAAAPLADEPWFRDLMLGTGNSMVLAFFVAALLTFIVQSSGAVSVFGISLAAVDIISVDQAIMIIYGSFIGSSAIMYVLSANLRGRSRQLAMYMVIHNLLVCAVTIPLHYAEVYLDVPLMKALISATGFDLSQQLALVYLIPSVVPVPIMIAGLGVSSRILERLWPASEIDELSRTEFIHDRASVDVETSLVLVDLEQRRVFRMLSGYFELVRQNKDVGPLRDVSRTVLSEINEFLTDLHTLHPMQGGGRPQCTVESPKTSFVDSGRHGRHVRGAGRAWRPAIPQAVSGEHMRGRRQRVPVPGQRDGRRRQTVLGHCDSADRRSRPADAHDAGQISGGGSAITQARYGQHPADNKCGGRDILPVVEAGGGFQPVLRRGAVTAPAQAERNPPAGACSAKDELLEQAAAPALPTVRAGTDPVILTNEALRRLGRRS